MDQAREKGLEIFCEGRSELVYCPPLTGRADSKAIWVLLAAAVTLAVGGTAVAWRMLNPSGVTKGVNPTDDPPAKEP